LTQSVTISDGQALTLLHFTKPMCLEHHVVPVAPQHLDARAVKVEQLLAPGDVPLSLREMALQDASFADVHIDPSPFSGSTGRCKNRASAPPSPVPSAQFRIGSRSLTRTSGSPALCVLPYGRGFASAAKCVFSTHQRSSRMDDDKAPPIVPISESRHRTLKAKRRSERDFHDFIADDSEPPFFGKHASNEQLIDEQHAAQVDRLTRDAVRSELARGRRVGF
jgi:hypothetical protein